MKTIAFSTAKRPLLIFEAEEASYEREGEDILLTAQGRITFQDPAMAEEVLHGDQACFVSVREAEEELMHQRFRATFLVLEENALVVRLSP